METGGKGNEREAVSFADAPSGESAGTGGKGSKRQPWRPPLPSQGDFVLVDILAGGQRPGLVAIAGEDPLVVDASPESIKIQPQQQTRNAPQTTSYWSVHQQNEFSRLFDIWGTDWIQVANGLESKTPDMVCIYE